MPTKEEMLQSLKECNPNCSCRGKLEDDEAQDLFNVEYVRLVQEVLAQ